MKIYYDTEFIEDGHTIELISIGMVAEDGRELYLINEGITDQPLYDQICRHSWLMANVIPHLPMSKRGDHLPEIVQPVTTTNQPGRFGLDLDHIAVMPLRQIRKQVLHFLRDRPGPGPDYSQTELWAWYGAYDHVALAQLWGPMIRLPEGVPMWTNDLKQECHRLGDPDLPDQPAGEHNALEDARHLKVRAEWLAARSA